MTDFHTGLFDFFSDMGVCCMGWYCPCLLSCQNQEKLEGYKSMRHCCMPMSEYYIRQVIRQRQNYSHAGVSDCCAYGCCYTCFVCQDARELNKGYGLPLKGEGYKGHISKSSGKEHKHDKDKQNKEQTAPAPQQMQQQPAQQPVQQPQPYYPDPQYAQQPGYPNYSNAPQYPNAYAPVPQGYPAYPPQQNGIPPVQPNENYHKKDDSSSSSSSS